MFDDDPEFLPLIRQQAMAALVEASVAILVVDGQLGLTAGDRDSEPNGCVVNPYPYF